MKKIAVILILLLLSDVSFGVYTAPAKDTVCVVGGLGTQAAANGSNGGGATKTAWDAGSPSDFIGTNGAAKFSSIDVVYDHTGGAGERLLTKANIGLGITVGTLAWVEGTNITAGRYEITSVIDNNNICCANIDATDDTADAIVYIGGSLPTLQGALDAALNNAASYNRYIYDNVATETITATINVNTYGGSATTRVFVIGYNATLTLPADIIITTNTDLTTNALLKITTVDFLYFEHIDFSCGGAAANKGGYGVYAAATADGQATTFYKCTFRGAEIDGVNMRSTASIFIDCKFFLNGRYGFANGAGGTNFQLWHCEIHDNISNGVHLISTTGWAGQEVKNCIIYDNGGHGICYATAAQGGNAIIGNTIYGNTNNGIDFLSTSGTFYVYNNSCVGNGGYGYDLNGGIASKIFTFFGYNHSSVNVSGHYSEGADGTFTALCNGNNQADTAAANTIFTNVGDGTEDFTPLTGSDLVNNALAPMSATTNDIGAIQEASGGGTDIFGGVQ